VELVKHIIEAAVTFFVVIDPIGTVPLFLSATKGTPAVEQRRIASKAIVIAAAILIFFIALGQILFDHLGIGLHAFRVAGGLVLLIVSLRMILEADLEGVHVEDKNNKQQTGDPAVFPIALPYIAGPGTIMAVVLQTDNDLYAPAEQAVIACVLVVILAFTWGTLLSAAYFQKWLGKTGIDVVTRIMGMILAALAVQTILAGIGGYFKI
jgi:multiple antibiotic resistance protein